MESASVRGQSQDYENENLFQFSLLTATIIIFQHFFFYLFFCYILLHLLFYYLYIYIYSFTYLPNHYLPRLTTVRIFLSNEIVHKISFSLCFWAPGPLMWENIIKVILFSFGWYTRLNSYNKPHQVVSPGKGTILSETFSITYLTNKYLLFLHHIDKNSHYIHIYILKSGKALQLFIYRIYIFMYIIIRLVKI